MRVGFLFLVSADGGGSVTVLPRRPPREGLEVKAFPLDDMEVDQLEVIAYEKAVVSRPGADLEQ